MWKAAYERGIALHGEIGIPGARPPHQVFRLELRRTYGTGR